MSELDVQGLLEERRRRLGTGVPPSAAPLIGSGPIGRGMPTIGPSLPGRMPQIGGMDPKIFQILAKMLQSHFLQKNGAGPQGMCNCNEASNPDSLAQMLMPTGLLGGMFPTSSQAMPGGNPEAIDGYPETSGGMAPRFDEYGNPYVLPGDVTPVWPG